MVYADPEARKAYHAAWYARNKASVIARSARNGARRRKDIVRFLAEYLSSHPCIDCGESDIVVLDFDHITGIKTVNLAEVAGDGYSTKRIEEEIAKCVVRCANCHRRKTAKQRGWFRASYVSDV